MSGGMSLEGIVQSITQNPIAADLLKVLGGVLASIAVALLGHLYTWYRYRRVRRFWRWFIGKRISIVMTEYPYQGAGSDANSQFAQRAGGGFLVSRGNALAMSSLQQFLSTDVTKKDLVHIVGDKTGNMREQHVQHVVVTGSPANNNISKAFFRTLDERFDLPWIVKNNPSTGDIYFETQDKRMSLRPDVEGGNGVDYAMVVRTRFNNPADRYVIILAGAFMYATQEAADAVSNRQVIDYVAKHCNGADDIMFIARVPVSNGSPLAFEIEFDGSHHVYPLTRKHA